MKEEREAFKVVKAFLGEHRGSTLPEVVEGTEVPLEMIVDMIHEGLLILREFPNLTLECERCGLPTQDGRFCQSCSNHLIMDLANATEKVKKLRQEYTGGYYSK